MNPKLLTLAAAIVVAATQSSNAAGVVWQWTGNAGTGDWQTANNWSGNVSNTEYNGTFNNRLNVNGAQKLTYTAAEGTTVYTGNVTTNSGLVVGSTSNGTMEITGGTFSTAGSAGTVIGNGNNATGILTVNGGNFISTNGTKLGLGTGAGRVSILNVQAGTATVGTLNMNSTNATVNLSGTGILAATSITKAASTTATFNFDGGTLQASAASSSFLTANNTYVKSGFIRKLCA